MNIDLKNIFHLLLVDYFAVSLQILNNQIGIWCFGIGILYLVHARRLPSLYLET